MSAEIKNVSQKIFCLHYSGICFWIGKWYSKSSILNSFKILCIMIRSSTGQSGVSCCSTPYRQSEPILIPQNTKSWAKSRDSESKTHEVEQMIKLMIRKQAKPIYTIFVDAWQNGIESSYDLKYTDEGDYFNVDVRHLKINTKVYKDDKNIDSRFIRVLQENGWSDLCVWCLKHTILFSGGTPKTCMWIDLKTGNLKDARAI